MAEPKIRFKRDDGSDYSAWQEVMLGDVASRVTRKNSKNETDRPLTIASIEGLVDQRTYFGKTIASKDMSGYFQLKKGEFAYNKSYSAGYDYGSIKRLDKYDMGALSTLYICFALNDTENSDFYNCYFNGLSWYNQMPSICAEGARNHGLLNVPPSDFFKIRLSVPSSKEEQQKIADFLSAVDEVIAASGEEVANLETQKKAVMKKIFSQEVRFKRADGSDFSVWEEKKVSELGSIIGGGTPKTSVEEYWNGDIPWISSADLEENNIHSVHMTRFITDEAIDSSATKRVPEGAILIITRVGVGKVAIAPCNLCTSQDYMSIVSEDGDRTFIGYALSKLMQNKVANVQGTSIKGIPSDEIREYKVGIPCLEEQRLIADFLSDFDEAIAAAKKELELWKELKKGLLQQMFV